MQTAKIYKTTQPGKPLITAISSGCKSPVLEVKFCNLLNPFFYQNSKTVPRYSLTCIINPNMHPDFLAEIQSIEKTEGVDSILKEELVKENNEHKQTGNILIKFQRKEKIPIYILEDSGSETPVTLEDEFEAGENVVVIYDIMRYTKKGTMNSEHGISFKPSKIYWYPKEEA
jgi:hypothetical protein